MAQVNNSDLAKEYTEAIRSSGFEVPKTASLQVVPVVEVNPKLLRVVNLIRSTVATNATAQTVYTTPSNKDFYLTYAEISLIKDASSDSLTSAVKVYVDGDTTQRDILRIASLATTAQSECVSLSFIPPIKLSRGTIIQVSNSTATANCSAYACIGGYVTDSSA